jgi:hypothetical protein
MILKFFFFVSPSSFLVSAMSPLGLSLFLIRSRYVFSSLNIEFASSFFAPCIRSYWPLSVAFGFSKYFWLDTLLRGPNSVSLPS